MNTAFDDSAASLPTVRNARWYDHPIICAGAVLPTAPVLFALSLLKKHGRRQRSSLAFWAHPRTGKSSCIEAMELVVKQHFPGAGMLVHEAKRDLVPAEGSFIGDMLLAMGFEPGLQRGLPERRNQLRRALFAMGAGASHLFIIIDEAQNLIPIQLEWLKEYKLADQAPVQGDGRLVRAAGARVQARRTDQRRPHRSACSLHREPHGI